MFVYTYVDIKSYTDSNLLKECNYLTHNLSKLYALYFINFDELSVSKRLLFTYITLVKHEVFLCGVRFDDLEKHFPQTSQKKILSCMCILGFVKLDDSYLNTFLYL